MRPFKGVRVLDLTHVFAGPFSAYQLGVLGAEIIKIEAVDQPDMTRSEGVDPALNARGMGLMFQAQAGGKKALALNLKTAKGRVLFDRLVAKADVVIQNFSTRCVAELGLDYERLKVLNPSLIYCVISGYGQTGPKQFHPAYDNVIQAYSGLMAANGDSGQPPLRIGPAMVDYGTGAQAALAISAALYGRAQTGQGRFIDVSMADAALMLMTSYTAATIATGDNPVPHGNQDPDLAGYGSFETAAGTLMIGAFTNRQMSNLMRAVGDDLAADEIANCPRAQIGERQAKDVAMLTRILRTKTADEWEVILNDHHVPAAKVRRLNQALAEDQIASRNVTQHAVEGQHSSGLPVAAFSYDHGTPHLDHPPRAHGQDSRDVLAAIGVENAEFETLRQQGVVG